MDFRSPGAGRWTSSASSALNRANYAGPLSVEWEDPEMAREHGAAEAVGFATLQFRRRRRRSTAAFAE